MNCGGVHSGNHVSVADPPFLPRAQCRSTEDITYISLVLLLLWTTAAAIEATSKYYIRFKFLTVVTVFCNTV
jgi:hypothetical protein